MNFPLRMGERIISSSAPEKSYCGEAIDANEAFSKGDHRMNAPALARLPAVALKDATLFRE